MNTKKGNKEVSNKAIKSSLWSVICTFIQATASFLTLPIFTRLLSPNDYGIVTNYNSWQTILLPICSLCLYVGVNKAIFDYSDEVYQYISSQLFLIILVVCLSYFIVPKIINLNLPSKIVKLMFISFISSSAFNMFSTLQRFQFKYKLVTVLSLLIVTGDFLLSYVFIKNINSEKFLLRIVGQNLTSIIIGFFLLLVFFLKGHKFFALHFWKYGSKIGVPMIFHNIGMQILNQSDRIMINNMCGSYDAGLYSVPASICNILILLWTSITNGLVPWIYTKLHTNSIKEIYNFINSIIRIVSFVVITFIVLAPMAMKILADKEYQDGVKCMPAVAIGMFFLCIYSIIVTIENFHKKTIYVAICTTITALINILLNGFLIPKLGYYAAAYTTMLCYMILAVLHYNVSKKIDNRQILPVKEMIKCGVVTIGIGIGIGCLYAYGIWRYIIYVCYVIIFLWINRKDIFTLIMKIKY